VRLKLSIEPHDLEVKKNKIREFLQKGHKTKITLVLRGREMAFLNRAYEFLEKLRNDLGLEIKKEKEPERLGNRISVIWARK